MEVHLKFQFTLRKSPLNDTVEGEFVSKHSSLTARIVAIQQWAIEWGILIMYFISYGCSFISGPASFRLAWYAKFALRLISRGIQAVPALFLLIALIPFPFSPRWLAAKGRFDESLDVIANIHGGGDKNLPVVRAEFNDVRKAAEEAKLVKWHMMFGKKMWRRTFIGCFTQIWQQLTGGNVMVRSPTIPI